MRVVSIGNVRELLGAPFFVRVHYGWLKGRSVCVGLDVRAFTQEEPPAKNIKMKDGWDELNSPRLRALPIGTLVEDLRSGPGGLIDFITAVEQNPEYAEHPENIPALTQLKADLQATTGRPRRGRVPALSDEDLRTVVAPAYLMGGKRPVQSVRAALQEHGLEGAGPAGEVTIDQARKAVTRARKLDPPAIAPATKKGKP